jgi:hypothetical protein
MTYHRNIDKINTTDANGPAYPSGGPEFNYFFVGFVYILWNKNDIILDIGIFFKFYQDF